MANLEFHPSDRVLVHNTRDWMLSFPSVEKPGQGIMLPPRKSTRVSYMDIENQVQTPGSFFYGEDGFGTGAPVQITDEAAREALYGAQGAGEKQLTVSTVAELLAISPLSAFENALMERIVTDGDKRMLARLAEEAGLDEAPASAGKKKLIEKYTGYSVVTKEQRDAEPNVTTREPAAI